MELYTLKGKIHKIMLVQDITDKFSKQEFVVHVLSQGDKATYSEFIKMQCINDKINKMLDIEEGDFCLIYFNVSGRKYKKEGQEEMYFTNLVMQDINVLSTAGSEAKEIKAKKDPNDYSDLFPGLESLPPKEEKTVNFDTDPDDLPF